MNATTRTLVRSEQSVLKKVSVSSAVLLINGADNVPNMPQQSVQPGHVRKVPPFSFPFGVCDVESRITAPPNAIRLEPQSISLMATMMDCQHAYGVVFVDIVIVNVSAKFLRMFNHSPQITQKHPNRPRLISRISLKCSCK